MREVSLEIPLHGSDVRTLKRALLSGLTGGRLVNTKRVVSVKALDSLSLEIQHGDRIGLIGHNGAGKSTFLRLLCGILTPTAGQLEIPNYFTPLIDKSFLVEPQLSGFDALKAHFLLHHRSMSEFQNFVDDVTEFAEIGDFIRLPLESYSEGMKTRLLFAIHTYFSHDLLALDEGIGAGDRAFMRKASDRMQSFLNRSGTLLLASHSEPMLRAFCNKIYVFRKGEIVFSGGVAEGLSFYHNMKEGAV